MFGQNLRLKAKQPSLPIKKVYSLCPSGVHQKMCIHLIKCRYEEHHTTLFTYPRIYPEYDNRLQPYITQRDFQNLLALLKEQVEQVK